MRRKRKQIEPDAPPVGDMASVVNPGFKKGTDYQPAPERHVEVDVPAALASAPKPERSLADELVARAEASRVLALHPADKSHGAIYIGDAILALTERLTELDQ